MTLLLLRQLIWRPWIVALLVGGGGSSSSGILTTTMAYPVIMAIEEQTERCFEVNIPEDDDVHMIFIPIPDLDYEIEDHLVEELEYWMVEQMYKMTKQKSLKGVLPMVLPDQPPDKVAEVMSEYLKENYGNGAPIKIKLNIRDFDGKKAMTNYRTKFFAPLTINKTRQIGRKLEDVEGAEICMENVEESKRFHVIFDSILDSEEVPEATDNKSGFRKDAHLTPLEESLEKSIVAARNVLKEMDYMEKREKRMRVTSDSINSRVQWFSYLSVAILFVVTYVQVTYLRRYFHKKKLM
jgi:hypothetical protein